MDKMDKKAFLNHTSCNTAWFEQVLYLYHNNFTFTKSEKTNTSKHLCIKTTT